MLEPFRQLPHLVKTIFAFRERLIRSFEPCLQPLQIRVYLRLATVKPIKQLPRLLDGPPKRLQLLPFNRFDPLKHLCLALSKACCSL